MKRIGILGAIGSGKSYISRSFGYPVFNADQEVSKLYQKDKKNCLQHCRRLYLKNKNKLIKRKGGNNAWTLWWRNEA